MHSRRSQAAMEFLMTYGWALLVVLIVIAALAFFGLLNPNRFLPPKCEFGPGLTCADFNAQSNGENPTNAKGNITILLNNGIGQTMNNIYLNVTACENSGSVVSPIVGDMDTDAVGRSSTSEWSGLGVGSTVKFKMNCTGMIPRTKFKSDLTLVYNVNVDTQVIPHSRAGYLVVDVD